MLHTRLASRCSSALALQRYAVLAGIIAMSLAFSPLSHAQADIAIHGDLPFPESISSTNDGTMYVGSAAHSLIFRVIPGATSAELWIMPGTNGLQRVLGVFADGKAGILWVCSTKLETEPTALKTFNLKTGASKGSYTFPGGTGVCNDIAVGSNGDAFITDTTNGRILRLKPGASALEVWAKDDRLIQADGIAFGDESNLYVNTFRTGNFFRIAIAKNGSSGAIQQLHTTQPLNLPDGLRSIGKNEFLMIEGVGRLDRVTVEGDTARIEVLKEGFNAPTAVTRVGNTAWVIEGKLKYMNDPAFKGQDPGPFKIYAVPLRTAH